MILKKKTGAIVDKSPADHPKWISLKVWNYLTLFWGIVLSIVLAGGLIAYLFLLFTGRAILPPAIVASLVNFLVIVLGGAGLWWKAHTMIKASDANTTRTIEAAEVTSERAASRVVEALHNGGGEAIAEKVVAKINGEEPPGDTLEYADGQKE